MENNMYFTRQYVDISLATALSDFLQACKAFSVKIDCVDYYLGGFRVTFVGLDGDAICHEHSYNSPCWMGARVEGWEKEYAYWETMGFPWDEDDVTTHKPYELAAMIAALQRGTETF